MASRIPLAAMNIYNGNSFSLNIMATKRGDSRNKGILSAPLYDKWIKSPNILIFDILHMRKSINSAQLFDVMVR